jgi:hypothetical protein
MQVYQKVKITQDIINNYISNWFVTNNVTPFPAPYLADLIPDSNLPSTTGNFAIHGSFLTPDTIITIEGQTVNYQTFVSDNLINVNVTTGAAEGYFDLTLTNGSGTNTYNEALFIVLGEVFQPTISDVTITGFASFSDKLLSSTLLNSAGRLEWSKVFDYTKNYEVRFNIKQSPLGVINSTYSHDLIMQLVGATQNVGIYWNVGVPLYFGKRVNNVDNNTAVWSDAAFSYNVDNLTLENIEFKFKYDKITQKMQFYADNVLKFTFAPSFTENMILKAGTLKADIKNIRYIELA